MQAAMGGLGSMIDPYGGAWLKAERAGWHLNALEGELEAFYRTKPYRAQREPDPDREGAWLYSLRVSGSPSADTYLELGDWAHALRTSLNYLASDLSESHNGIAEFPIYLNRDEGRFGEEISQFPAGSIRDFVESFQPQGETDSERREDPLWLLHELDRIDTQHSVRMSGHRVLVLTGLHGPSYIYLGNSPDLSDGDLLLSWTGASDEHAEPRPQLVAEARFDLESEPAASVGAADLRSIQDYVTAVMLPAFSRFFA